MTGVALSESLAEVAWRAIGGLANAAVHWPWGTDSKLARSFRVRRGVAARLNTFARSVRDPSRPLVWMHAPSVGEGLQARPVLDALRAAHPDWQLAYTFYSPSAETFAKRLSVDFADALPFDTAANATLLLDTLQPSALVFSKLDVWPMLVRAAARRGIPVAMTSATLRAGSGRQSSVVASLLRPAYGALAAVGAITRDDGARLVQLGVRADAVEVTGDTRYDQVWARADAAQRTLPFGAPDDARPLLVAGSTWPADEGALLPAWERIAARWPQARLMVAPHEPTPAAVQRLETWARDRGLRVARVNAADAREASVVLVDTVGQLGDLYSAASFAFVGGGFHAAGLHSVLEPAAYGVPVLCGPASADQPDAVALASAGALTRVSSADAVFTALASWLAEPAARARAGDAARAVVAQHRGATARSVALIERLMPPATRAARPA